MNCAVFPSDSTCPRVAVIVPAYGVAHFVGEALASLQGQTLEDWECVVIDDGAPDDVAGAVAPFLADPRIRLLRTPNRGVSAARNTAIRASQAPLIALLDGDDRFDPGYLEAMVTRIEQDSSVRLATCNALIFGSVPREHECYPHKQGRGDGIYGTLDDVLDRSFGVYIGSTFRRADFEAVGGFDESMNQAEDLDLWVRLMLLGGRAHFDRRMLGQYRVRPGSASADVARLLQGNLKVYAKAAAALPSEAPQQALIARMVDRTRRELEFELAMKRVLDGDIGPGLAELRARRDLVKGPVWMLSFALWRVAPALARPMLSWRLRSNRRSAGQQDSAQLVSGAAA